MQKKSLKWFLIHYFLIILLCIYISEELISLLYRLVVFPGLVSLFEMQQITISGNGNVFIFMIQLLLYYLVSFLPKGTSDYLQSFLTKLFGIGLQFEVTSPLYQGRWAALLTVSFLLLLLFLLAFSLLPYIAGTLCYYKIVTGKVNELLEEEKERQLNYERRRNLLLSDIAHDIKTPITTICGYSKALSEGVAQEEKRMDYLNAIYGKALRIDELITLLFEYVKLDSEGYILHKEPGDLAELLRETIAAHYADFEEKQIALTIDIPDDGIPCEMDSLQIGRAITNLLTNALRYGREKGKVLVRLRDDVHTVADDGKPIDPDFAERIFDPFSREDSSRRTKEGSGLGLSISAKIVEMHGGELLLNQEFGEGYTKAFQIRLPEH